MRETWNQAEISEDIKPVNYVNADSWNAAELNEAINLFGIEYPIDTWNPAELDEKARNIINDITSTKTITGNPISFKTINGGYAKSCEVTFSPIQSGTGDPSPENIRPISGRDSLHLYQAESGSTPETTHTATFPDTVYGGKLDFVSGKLTITDIIIVFNGTEEGWGKAGTDGTNSRYYISLTDEVMSGDAGICNYLNRTAGNTGEWGTYNVGSNVFIVKDKDNNFQDLNAYKAYLGTNNLQLSYKLATPQEITLTPETIELLKGNNTLWTDGDNINLKYTKLALPDDSGGLSLNQKVKKAIEIIKGKEIKEETKKSTTKGRRKKL